RDAGGDNESRTKVVKEKYENHDDQQHASKKIPFHDLRRQRHQVATVVERKHFDILGQDFIVEFLGLRFNPLQDVLSFFARPQQDHAFYRVVQFLVAELTEARGDTDLHTADVLYQHRSAVVHCHDHVADVLQGIHAPHAAHVVELTALRIEPAAG